MRMTNTIPQKRRGIADQLKGYMGVEVGVGGDGGYTFTSGSKENATLFKTYSKFFKKFTFKYI